MQINRIFFPEDIYSQYLDIINGVKFSPREIDVLSCLITARGASKTASFLNISPNTVFSHIRNVMSKLGRNSREGIIDFLEASGKLRFLREYNSSLLVESLFVNLLRDCLKLKPNIPFSDLGVLCYDNHLKNAFVNHFRKHLDRAGFEINVIDGDKDQNIDSSREEIQSRIIFVSKKISMTSNSFSEANFLDLGEQNDYYLASLRIIQSLSPETNFEILIKNFSEQYNLLKSSISKQYDTIDEDKALRKKKNELRETPRRSSQNKKWRILIGACSIGVLLLGFQIIKENKKMQISPSQANMKGNSIRSDMVIPTESGLLQRPEEVAKLDSIFKKQGDIQSIAIVGPGGAGKTVLARQYARRQETPVVWEINVETPDTLNASFENLAYALATTVDNKKKLKEIQDTKSSEKRASQVIQFVKDHLKSYSNWLLIYDNVERFQDIQRYFPQDSVTWGRGKIILTTRDKNIQNNNNVNSSIQIQELNNEEKLNLFLKIMLDEETSLFSESQKEEARQFLENIPPYPLDVSIAAYYLKSTRVSYAKYLENLFQNEKTFTRVQKNVLKEAGDYTQTRYDIITLSLQNLINTDKEFGDLFFFISLLDSQNIPRDFLDTYKNHVVVDNFIYHLKKYSLITDDSPHDVFGQTVSLHRSTQSITLDYFSTMQTKEKTHTLLQRLIETLEAYVQSTIDSESLPKMRPLINHLKMLLTHSHMLDNHIKGSIYSQLGRLHYHLRDYIKSKELFEKSFAILKNEHLSNDEKLITILKYLAIINMELGNHEKAKDLVECCLSNYKTYFSNEHINVAGTLAVMGDVYGVVGEYEKAKNIFEKSIGIYKKHPPKNHTEGHARSAYALALLGNVYGSLGEYEKARSLLEKSLKIYEEFFPESCFAIAAIFTLLGNSYVGLGEYEKGKTLLEEGIKIYKKNLPKNHIDLAWALVYSANAFEKLGNDVQAKAILERSLEVHNELLGKSNIRSAWVLFHLGSVNVKLGLLQQARGLLQKALIAYEKDYGKDHIETARIYRSFGQAELAEGNLEEAEKYFHRALKIFQVSNHADRHIILEDLAQIYHEKSKRAKDQGSIRDFENNENQAAASLHQAMEIIKAHFPENSPHIKRIQKKIDSLEAKS